MLKEAHDWGVVKGGVVAPLNTHSHLKERLTAEKLMQALPLKRAERSSQLGRRAQRDIARAERRLPRGKKVGCRDQRRGRSWGRRAGCLEI